MVHIFVICIILCIFSIAIGIQFIRQPVLYVETKDMDAEFLEGLFEAQDVLNFRLIKDDPDPNCASATVITSQNIECGDKLITYGGARTSGGVLHVDANAQALLRRALDVAYAKKAARIAVISSETDDIDLDTKAYVSIKTTPKRVLEDVFRALQNRVLDVFVIMDPSLMFDRRKVDNSKLVIACGFKGADGADISVSFDPKEQGYMVGVLAYNMHKGRRLFKDKNIFTKIYVT